LWFVLERNMFMMQNFLGRTNATDASGNTVLGDFGVHIQQEVSDCLYSGSSWMELMVIKLHGSYGKCMIFFLRTTIAWLIEHLNFNHLSGVTWIWLKSVLAYNCHLPGYENSSAFFDWTLLFTTWNMHTTITKPQSQTS
jgi:hypothetical protein